MNNLDPLLQRNKEFAAHQSAEGTLMPSLPRAMPNVKAIIIGCADMRVDPAHVLGIKPGEAIVLRNIGGRITPGLLEQLALLGRIGEVAGEIAGGGREFLERPNRVEPLRAACVEGFRVWCARQWLARQFVPALQGRYVW